MTKNSCFFMAYLLYTLQFCVVNVGKSTAHLSQEYHQHSYLR